jgi:hypothetical protein
MTLRIGSIALRQNRPDSFEKCAHRLTRTEADILVVAGFRTGMEGLRLRSTLDRLGLIYQTPCDTDPHEKALILAARCPFLEIALPQANAAHGNNFRQVNFADFHLIAWDLMDAPAAPALERCILNQAQELLRDKALLFSRPMDRPRSRPSSSLVAPEDLTKRLMGSGYLDAYQLAPESRKIDGNGADPTFGALVTPALASRMCAGHKVDEAKMAPTPNWELAVLRVG